MIGPEHPDYLKMFYKGFGAGQSFTGRQAERFAANPPRSQEQDSAQPPYEESSEIKHGI